MLFHCPSSCGFCEQQANWYAKSFERLGIPLTEDLQQRISKAETNAGGTSPNEAVVGDTGSFESSSKFTLSSTDNGSDECVDKEKDCDIRQRGGQCEEYPV